MGVHHQITFVFLTEFHYGFIRIDTNGTAGANEMGCLLLTLEICCLGACTITA